jgi:hypothetical protein
MLPLLLVVTLAQASDYYECMVQAELTRVEPIGEQVVRADLQVVSTAGGRCAHGAKPGAVLRLPEGVAPSSLVPALPVLLYLHHSSGVTAAGPSSMDSWAFLGVADPEAKPPCRMEAAVVDACNKPGCTWLQVVPSTPTTSLGCPPRGIQTRIEAITPASAERFQAGDRLRGTQDGPYRSWTLGKLELPEE